MTLPKVNWPADLNPKNSPVYSYNELDINADPKVVWAWLVKAESWPDWYPNCKNIQFLHGGGPDLKPRSEFIWITFGVKVKTRIQDFLPYKQLSWRGSGLLGAQGFHSWIVTPTPMGCKVITEEVQKGLVPYIGQYFFKKLLRKYHQLWLEGLARIAVQGPPE